MSQMFSFNVSCMENTFRCSFRNECGLGEDMGAGQQTQRGDRQRDSPGRPCKEWSCAPSTSSSSSSSEALGEILENEIEWQSSGSENVFRKKLDK